MVFLKLSDSCPQDVIDIMGLVVKKSEALEYNISDIKVQTIMQSNKYIQVLSPVSKLEKIIEKPVKKKTTKKKVVKKTEKNNKKKKVKSKK